MSGTHADGDVTDTAAAVRDVVREAAGRLGLQQAAPIKRVLQDAGYKQKAEKWDTDSDSDSSDEEDLKM